MRMNLKNNSRKFRNIKSIKITSKNLFIFLASFSIITILIGVLFYFLMSSADKETVNNIVKNNFEINSNYDYFSSLKQSILSNTYDIFLIWILGISVIGVFANIFIYFSHLFSIGFTITSIISMYKAKGLIASLLFLIPSKICYLLIIFLLTFYSIRISYKIFRLCFTKEDIKIKSEITKYFKILLFFFIAMIGVSFLEVFIDPIFIKLFTKI